MCTVSKAKKQLAFVLLSAVLFNIPKFIEYRVEYVTYDNGTTYSAAAAYSGLLSYKLYYIVYDNILYFIFNLALPVFILMLLNIRTILALKAIRRTRIEMQSVRQQQDNNITFVLIIVVTVFIICQVPALINKVMWNVAPGEARHCGGFQFYLSHIANMLVIFNSFSRRHRLQTKHLKKWNICDMNRPLIIEDGGGYEPPPDHGRRGRSSTNTNNRTYVIKMCRKH